MISCSFQRKHNHKVPVVVVQGTLYPRVKSFPSGMGFAYRHSIGGEPVFLVQHPTHSNTSMVSPLLTIWLMDIRWSRKHGRHRRPPNRSCMSPKISNTPPGTRRDKSLCFLQRCTGRPWEIWLLVQPSRRFFRPNRR